MNDYCLILDVWAGNLDIDEQILQDARVRALIIRLNSITGGLTPDTNFGAQWEQAARFYRAPYFVLNPYLTGLQNVEWMGDHLPPGVKRVYYDIEVRRTDLPPADYAREVDIFYRQAAKFWIGEIYTGPWFVPLLSKWPVGASYWWGRYPFVWYPAASVQISWDAIHDKIKATAWAPACNLGTVHIWQISGDRMKPPGCNNRAIDINLFQGNDDDLRAYWGAEPIRKPWAFQVTEALRKLGQSIDDPPT